MLQSAIKCRGPEYLRIIYVPEFSLPENLSRLRKRALGHKRALALREFALGVEALERFGPLTQTVPFMFSDACRPEPRRCRQCRR